MAWTLPKASATAATPASIPAPSGTAAASERQQGAGAPEQERGEQRAGQQRHHADVGADRRRRFGREDAGAGEQEPGFARFGQIECPRGRRRRPRAGLRRRGRRRGCGRGGARGAGRPPAANQAPLPRLDAAFGEPGLGQAEEGAGGVGEAEAGQQRRGGAAEAVEQGFELGPERGGLEGLGPRCPGRAGSGSGTAAPVRPRRGRWCRRLRRRSGRRRAARRRFRARSARAPPAGRPSMPARSRLEAAPERSSPTRNALARVWPGGRNSAKPVRTSTVAASAAPSAASSRSAASSGAESRPGRRNGCGAVQVTRCTAYSILPVPSRRPAATNRLVFSQR